MLHIVFKISILLLFNFIFLHAEQITEDFRLDGYANINMIDTDKNTDKLKLSGGIQGRYQLTDEMSITGQVHFKEGHNEDGKSSNSLEEYNSDLKWLYLDYYLKNDITLRLGAFQFPVFKSSETGDIGYTYTWTQTPLSYYGVFGCDDFEGAELLKNFSYDDFDFLAQVSYGKSENKLSDGRGNTREGDVKDLIGLTLKTTHENFILNIGYLQAKSTMSLRSPFPATIVPQVDFKMYALESEIYINDYTLKSGFIKNELTGVYPEDIKYYTSLEYNYKDYTPYILYSNEILNFKNTPSAIPPSILKRLQKKQSKKRYSVGLRYDYSTNIAFKASYTHEIDSTKYNGIDGREKSDNIFIGTINVVF